MIADTFGNENGHQRASLLVTQARAQGQAAFAGGEGSAANPYTLITEFYLRSAWQLGWEARARNAVCGQQGCDFSLEKIAAIPSNRVGPSNGLTIDLDRGCVAPWTSTWANLNRMLTNCR